MNGKRLVMGGAVAGALAGMGAHPAGNGRKGVARLEPAQRFGERSFFNAGMQYLDGIARRAAQFTGGCPFLPGGERTLYHGMDQGFAEYGRHGCILWINVRERAADAPFFMQDGAISGQAAGRSGFQTSQENSGWPSFCRVTRIRLSYQASASGQSERR